MAKRSKKKKAVTGKNPVAAPLPIATPAECPVATPRLQRDLMGGVSLMLMVLLVYQPAWHAGLVWDDESVITLNPVIAGPYGLKEIWTTTAADICPLTLTTFWAEYKLWGGMAGPYHLVNILMQGGCAVALWQVLRHLRVRGAWLGAALWALHPVMVESAAWITEMKNTESGLFFLLSIYFYLKEIAAGHAGNRPGWSWNYALTLLFGALAMASKSSTVILPVVLGLCAWWMEGRWRWGRLLKIAPFFVLSLGAGLATLWTQAQLVASLTDSNWDRSWAERLATAGDTVWFYLGKLLWPHPLMTIYPRWNIDGGQVISFLPLLGALAVLALFWFKRESWARPWFFAFAYFLVALLPVMGLLNNTFFRFSFVADHFQYLASIGPLALAGAGLASVGAVRLKAALSGGILGVLGILSWQQARIYQDQQTLWSYALAWNPNCWLAQNGLGVWLVAQGRAAEAIGHYQEALNLNPNYRDAYYNLGVALTEKGDVEEAMANYRTLLAIDPNFAKGRNNLGFLLGRAGKTDEAIVEFQKAIQSDLTYAEARYNYAVALFTKGRRDEAVTELKNAVKLRPDYIQAYTSLGVALAQMNRTDEAAAQFNKILEIDPQNADAHNNIGIVRTMQHRDEEAMAEYRLSLAIKPNTTAFDNLGSILVRRGRVEEAKAVFEEALRLNPADAIAQNNLAETKRRMSPGTKEK